MKILKGMTWSHPRGFDPMVATSALWSQQSGVTITWDKRSLQDFESYPVEDLARAYDLIVIDHPHVGQITAEHCLLPLDAAGREAELAALAAGSVGASYASYQWQGHQWAFPIDAAAQVMAYRPDRLASSPPRTWPEVMALAHKGRVALPLRPPHSLMVFYTLAALMGHACRTEFSPMIEPHQGLAVLERMKTLAALVSPDCIHLDPIDLFERMALPDSSIDCVPLIYGYVPYAREGFRPARIAFADMPVDETRPCMGSALGGTGIAVSAFSHEPDAALDYAYYVASGAVQRGAFAASGGQPGHAEAWADAAVNAPVHDFYRATRATLQGAWVRPRHKGYMPFQHRAAELINLALTHELPADRAIDELNLAFAESFA